MTKIATIDLTSDNAEERKIIYQDKALAIREEINQLKEDQSRILDSMVVDQGVQADHDKCNAMREIDKQIRAKEDELNEETR